MNTEVIIPSLIIKENISGLHFPSNEVLGIPYEIKQRKSDVQTGMLLGNNYKCKVKILFEDSESLKQVETTIWGLTDLHVLLKSGITIPLNRIYKVDVCS